MEIRVIFIFFGSIGVSHAPYAEMKHHPASITLQDSLHTRSPYTRLTRFVFFCSRQLNVSVCVGLNEITKSNYQYLSQQLSKPTHATLSFFQKLNLHAVISSLSIQTEELLKHQYLKRCLVYCINHTLSF